MIKPLYGSALRAKKNNLNSSNAEARVHGAMPGMIAAHLNHTGFRGGLNS